MRVGELLPWGMPEWVATTRGDRFVGVPSRWNRPRRRHSRHGACATSKEVCTRDADDTGLLWRVWKVWKVARAGAGPRTRPPKPPVGARIRALFATARASEFAVLPLSSTAAAIEAHFFANAAVFRRRARP